MSPGKDICFLSSRMAQTWKECEASFTSFKGSGDGLNAERL